MSLATTERAADIELATGAEELRERIAALVVRRQQLRGSGASRASLERNRRELARSQSELGLALIELHLPPLPRAIRASESHRRGPFGTAPVHLTCFRGSEE